MKKWIAIKLIDFGLWFFEQNDQWDNEDYRMYSDLQAKKRQVLND